MSVQLFTLFLDDPKPVLNWLAQHGGTHVVRQQTMQIVGGWAMKVALDDPSLAGRFRSQWADGLVTLDNQRKRMEQRRC
jgi:hypothetical protein